MTTARYSQTRELARRISVHVRQGAAIPIDLSGEHNGGYARVLTMGPGHSRWCVSTKLAQGGRQDRAAINPAEGTSPVPPSCKATPRYVPLLYLSETSANGIQWPLTAIARTSEMLALFCELAGQREMTCIWSLGGGLPPAQELSTTGLPVSAWADGHKSLAAVWNGAAEPASEAAAGHVQPTRALIRDAI